MNAGSPRWILHLDMDAFFASVEQLDNPELRGKPVIIGGAERGVVSTASYEARPFGVHSAMPMFQARRLCPQGIFLRGRMRRYQEKSREVMAVLERFSPLVEKASVDEAYLDATGLERIFGDVKEMALDLQRQVLATTGLTCSLGVAPVKFLAKIASDIHKPSGLTIIRHSEVSAFLQQLPIGKIPGVGKQTLKKLELFGVRHAADVQRYPLSFWQKHLGKAGATLYDRSKGVDSRPVEPYSEPKSEGAENTFAEDTLDLEVLAAWLLSQSERVGRRLRRQGLAGKTITLKLKHADFSQRTHSRTLKERTNSTAKIYETALALLSESNAATPLRLVGVTVSQLGVESGQLSLLPDEDTRRQRRDAALDALQDKFGAQAVVRGKLFSAKSSSGKKPEQ